VTLDLPFTAECVKKNWEKVISFDGKNENPTGPNETYPKIMANYEKFKAKS